MKYNMGFIVTLCQWDVPGWCNPFAYAD